MKKMKVFCKGLKTYYLYCKIFYSTLQKPNQKLLTSVHCSYIRPH